MRILYITPHNPFLKTPETGFAEEITKRGHHVSLAYGYCDELLKGEFDIVFGAMEYGMNLATWLGKKLNIPVCNHMEWIPPWRVGKEDPRDWGYERPEQLFEVERQIPTWRNTYIQQTQDWENATIRSTPGRSLLYTCEYYATKPIETEIKYYAADFKKLESYRDPTLKEKYQIVSTARLVPHKRIIHVIRALAKVKNAPKYVVIGYGAEQKYIYNEAERLGVDVEFVGSGDKGLKEKIIQESMFSVNIWAGIPIAEGAYFKKPAISYKEHHIFESMGDMPLWAERNNIDDLAEKIQYFVDNPEERIKWGEKAHDLMMNDKANMGSMDKLITDTIAILEKGIKKWEEQKN